MDITMSVASDCDPICIGDLKGTVYAEKISNIMSSYHNDSVENRNLCIDLKGVTFDEAFATQAFAIPIKKMREEQQWDVLIYFKVYTPHSFFHLNKALETQNLIGVELSVDETKNNIRFAGKTSSIFNHIADKMIRMKNFGEESLPDLMGANMDISKRNIRRFIESGIVHEENTAENECVYCVSKILCE